VGHRREIDFGTCAPITVAELYFALSNVSTFGEILTLSLQDAYKEHIFALQCVVVRAVNSNNVVRVNPASSTRVAHLLCRLRSKPIPGIREKVTSPYFAHLEQTIRETMGIIRKTVSEYKSSLVGIQDLVWPLPSRVAETFLEDEIKRVLSLQSLASKETKVLGGNDYYCNLLGATGRTPKVDEDSLAFDAQSRLAHAICKASVGAHEGKVRAMRKIKQIWRAAGPTPAFPSDMLETVFYEDILNVQKAIMPL